MSQVKIQGNASGTGIFTVASPNSNTDRTLTLPDATGTLNMSGLANEVPAGTAAAPSIYPTGDTNTGIFFPAADTIAFSEGGVEAARIDSSGNLLVGKTSAGAAASAGFQAYPAGTNTAVTSSDTSTTGPLFYFANIGSTVTNGYRFVTFRATSSFTEVGTITTNGTSNVSYGTTSDYRLKKDVRPMVGALATVARLNPVTYKWKVDGADGQGFIAHELQEVVPDAVVGKKDAVNADGNPEYQNVDTSFLVATLTAALQEAHGLIKNQGAAIESLTARMDAQAAEIAALKGAAS